MAVISLSVTLFFDCNWLRHLLQQLVQVRSLEQPVAIHRIPVHWKVASGCPIADRIVMDAKVLGRLCGLHVFRQFGHGLGLGTLTAIFAKAIA
jgi:hypothetical protein